jgi:hypothetical protein
VGSNWATSKGNKGWKTALANVTGHRVRLHLRPRTAEIPAVSVQHSLLDDQTTRPRKIKAGHRLAATMAPLSEEAPIYQHDVGSHFHRPSNETSGRWPVFRLAFAHVHQPRACGFRETLGSALVGQGWARFGCDIDFGIGDPDGSMDTGTNPSWSRIRTGQMSIQALTKGYGFTGSSDQTRLTLCGTGTNKRFLHLQEFSVLVFWCFHVLLGFPFSRYL